MPVFRHNGISVERRAEQAEPEQEEGLQFHRLG